MNKYMCVRELIFRLFRDVSLGRLCSNSLIASAPTTSRNLTPAPRGFKIACKRVLFFRPRLGGLPHLPGWVFKRTTSKFCVSAKIYPQFYT